MSGSEPGVERVSSLCVLIYDEENGIDADAMLAAALRRRGFDVRIVVVATRRRPAWRLNVAAWMERLVSRQPVASFPLSPVERITTADQLPELIASLQPQAVIHFADADLASAVVECGAYPLYQLSLNGRMQTLRMDLLEPDDGASLALAVTRLRRGWQHPRVVQRSEVAKLHSWSELDRSSSARRAIALLLRALDENVEDDQPLTTPIPARRSPLLASAAMIGSKVLDVSLRRWRREDAWFLAYRLKSGDAEFRFLFGGPERFFADPCAVRYGGDDLVFCEDYDYRRGRGGISVSRLQPDGTLSVPSPVLQRPYHLSYPFVFESDGSWWMVPETSENRTVELYRAVEFPSRWTLEATLLHDVFAADATLFHQGRWWMFVNLGEFESSTWDELSIFVADDLTGPWRPHPKNPVKRDLRSSRSAGRLFRRGDQLVRPAQVCSPEYGTAVRFCIVDELSEEEFSEHEAELIEPSLIPGAVGLHTWSETENLQVIDARFHRAWLEPARFARQAGAARRRAARKP